jgi:hypothetical protein
MTEASRPRRRGHAAAGGRVVAAGLSAALAVALVGGMVRRVAPDPVATPAAPAAPAPTSPASHGPTTAAPTPAATVAPPVTVSGAS